MPDLSTDTPRVSGTRLWSRLMAMAEIGATEHGGCNRQALTQADFQGRELFARWAAAAGCSVRVDAIGNLFARRAGRDESLPRGHDRQPSRYAADGRQIRRRVRRARRARGDRVAQRPIASDPAPDRDRRVVQRGRLPLPGRDDGLGRVVGAHAARRRLCAQGSRRAERARGARAGGRRSLRADRRASPSRPPSKFTSSRARCSSSRRRTSASSRACST